MRSVLSRTYRTFFIVPDVDDGCREGTHAKYHYMICGVQGDFTRSLVNDPPRTLWTRELKVVPTPLITEIQGY